MALTGCTQTPTAPLLSQGRSPLDVMTLVAKGSQKCWFDGKNATFLPFRMADERGSHSGRPRILVVPKNNPGGLPKLVVQAERTGGQTRVSAFGPLLTGAGGAKLSGQINSWAAGSDAC
jgi:hypothetical protein